jgi:hypothetical protein
MAALAFAVLSCGDSAHEHVAAHAALGGDMAARVGDVGLPASLVGAVAAEHRISAAAALDLLIDDVVAAKGAAARHLDETAEARFAQLTVLSRATIDRARDHARATRPTDDEVHTLSALHWLEVDRPETFLVVHAVVTRPKSPDPAAEKAAIAVAEAIAAAEVGAVSPEDFLARAKAVPHGHAEVIAESLEPFTADGRVALPGNRPPDDPRFAAGAAALASPGATSGVVESSFGWHVIRLTAKYPAVLVPFEERRRMFAEEVYDRRARQAVDAIEADRRGSEPVDVANGVDELLTGALRAARSPGADTAAP